MHSLPGLAPVPIPPSVCCNHLTHRSPDSTSVPLRWLGPLAKCFSEPFSLPPSGLCSNVTPEPLLWPSVLSSVAAGPSCCSLSSSVPRVSHSLPCHLLVLPFLACPTPLEFHPQRLRIPWLHLASFLRAMAATQSPSPCLRGFGLWDLVLEVGGAQARLAM